MIGIYSNSSKICERRYLITRWNTNKRPMAKSGVEFWHDDRRDCLKGTCMDVLDEVELWARDFHKPPIYWLNGLAGTWKTTMARTFAERLFADGQLGASFFCSRDFDYRGNLRSVFPTLAVQLARKYPQFRSLFVPLVRSNPGISLESLDNQMYKLVVRPLKESNISTVIVIDALDECTDEEPASAILLVLGQFVSEIPRVKFFVTGRPDPQILKGFCLPLLAEETDMFVLHEVEPSQVADGILLFFRHELSNIVRRRRGLDDWPTEEQMDLLCERAAGLFAYAVATVMFIGNRIAQPRKQLDLLRSPESSAREVRTMLKHRTTLDSLYISTLRGAFGDSDDPYADAMLRSVLGAALLAANPLSPSTIAMLLNLDPLEDVLPLLSSLRSLLILEGDISSPVRPFHKSFPHFITDPDRCTIKRFRVSPPAHHSELLIGCLNLMNRTLEKDICKLPDAVTGSDASDLKEKVEQCICPGLQYACRSWHTHLVGGYKTLVNAHEITCVIHRFLETKFLLWLEVLSVLGAARTALEALQAAADRLEVSATLDLVNNCSRSVTEYLGTIGASSQHVYRLAVDARLNLTDSTLELQPYVPTSEAHDAGPHDQPAGDTDLEPQTSMDGFEPLTPAWKHLISRPLPTDERISLITAIFSDCTEADTVNHLHGGDAQAFVDVIDEVLSRSFLPKN
ncbi:hypothetical protein BJ322DRAFT_846481 [Thelephora terrestris]|uniref:Nephrocystin 3-like N-terminal domain-containing protein n=1 Tax=Thelephora terrestris TaxID=56493 RepID=A0A9P6HET1_9AGAM|nr:hypothetical protein BJ322DRAFT_846481 [Thelephora terrestris]